MTDPRRTKTKFLFTPELTSWKLDEVPSYIQQRLELREKRLKQAERMKKERVCREVDETIKKFTDPAASSDSFIKKPLFASPLPVSKRSAGIIKCQGGS